MRLFIAEKPSLGRAIANALPKPHKKADGYIEAANGDIVTWCIGHLLELQSPEGYDPSFKRWDFKHLPILPDRLEQKWLLVPKKQTAKQLRVVCKLIKQATQLIHAGDPDREGQLLVDEVIHYAGASSQIKARAQRCLISDLNPAAVSKAITSLRSNKDFACLSTSALARSRADWLYGINLTRAYTIQGKSAGYQGVLSVGRVQTPILGLVVKRDLAIQNFVAHPFYEVWANLKCESGQEFKAKWQPSEHCQNYLDEAGRNLSKALAENVAKRILNKNAEVKQVLKQNKKQNAPLPYNLSALQIDASKAFGLSAKSVLDICQNLYERHKLITYPRSDCRYLPLDHFKQAADILNSIKSNIQSIAGIDINQLPIDLKRKSKAWNNSKIGAHHAIIPTLKRSASLQAEELKIYSLICRNYLAQFLAAHEFSSTEVELQIEQGQFTAKAKQTTQEGWKILFPSKKAQHQSEHHSEDTELQKQLPPLIKGQMLHSGQADILEKSTSAPKPYNDASLLAAMTGISQHVANKDIKKILKDTDGLGTEATRAGIIEVLFKRGFLQRQGKNICATPAALVFINALPDKICLPDMTALWESKLASISEGQARYQELMLPLEQELGQLINESQNINMRKLSGLGSNKHFKKKKKQTATRKTKSRPAAKRSQA